MEFCVYGINSEVACKLMDELNDLGVSSNYTLGGISINPYGISEIDAMNRICKKHNIEAHRGTTPMIEDITYMRRR